MELTDGAVDAFCATEQHSAATPKSRLKAGCSQDWLPHLEGSAMSDFEVPQQPKPAAALMELGGAYRRAGRMVEAHQAYVRALEIQEELLGPDHVELAGVYHNLAELELAWGRFTTGEPYARRALEIRQRAAGIAEGERAEDVALLAALLAGQGRTLESELLSRSAHAATESTDGPIDERIAGSSS
jgi:tetratricopeptide (TPR) repeat protein